VLLQQQQRPPQRAATPTMGGGVLGVGQEVKTSSRWLADDFAGEEGEDPRTTDWDLFKALLAPRTNTPPPYTTMLLLLLLIMMVTRTELSNSGGSTR